MKTFNIIAIVAVVAVLIVLFTQKQKVTEQPSVDSPASVQKAVDFIAKDIAGKEVKLSDYRGKVVLIDVWATWCGYCVQEMPDLVALQRDALKNNTPLQLIGFSVDEDRSKVKPFASEYKMNYPVVYGDETMLREFGSIPGLPTKFIIDKDGKVVDKLVGAMSRKDLEAKLAPYLP